MIKLTEVVSGAGHYSAEKRTVSVKYKLRNFYINPKFIISFVDNEKLNKIHERKYLIEALHSETRFTKLTVSSGGHGATYYDILGTPEQNLENILREEK